MALNFPANPESGDQYAGSNGVTYTYDGVKWVGAGVETGSGFPTASTTTAGVVKVDGTSITITNGVINSQGGGGGNPFNQSLNTTDDVTFDSVGTAAISVSQINGTNPGNELVIQANNHNWTFATDGNLTLPVGSDILDSTGTSVLHSGAELVGEGVTQVGSSLVIATDSGGGLTGWSSTAASIAYNANILSTYAVGSTITWQDGTTATLTQVDDYGPGSIDIFWNTPKTGTLFPITLKTADYIAAEPVTASITATGKQWTFNENGKLTLPAGGTITEGVVTSNPTIQLTPASPTVASQKLVIKGGGIYNAEANGIALNWDVNTALVGDTIEIYVYSLANANQTLYWWIHPAGAGISDPGSGTVALGEFGSSDGPVSFVLDSDDYEFTVRVSPVDNVYDLATTGVETSVFNSSAPSFGNHHLHLTTGDLTETSIFLGTDDHNVRTTVNGGIEITTPNTTNNVWQFGSDGNLTLPSGNTTIGNTLGSDAIISAPNTAFGVLSQGSTGFGGLQWLDTVVEPLNVAGIVVNSPYAASTGSVQIYTGVIGIPFQNAWTFDPDGTTTLPGAVANSTVAKTGSSGVPGSGQVATVTLGSTNNTNFTPGVYPGLGIGVGTGYTLTLTVAVNGDLTVEVTASGTGFFVGDQADLLGAAIAGGSSPADDIVLTVATLNNVVVATALDLTKSVNKLTDGYYTLANGTEGQIMYLVRQTSATVSITVIVANARVAGSQYTTIEHYPFTTGDMNMLIFTDGAWQANSGTWD